MVKAYPQFRSSYSHEEMVEHFLLTPAELQLPFNEFKQENRRRSRRSLEVGGT
jgi:hypothetical protein